MFHCLLELCRCQAKGIVEHAVLLGTPVGVTPQRWRMARTVVAGRLVNGYSNQDWVRSIPLMLMLCNVLCRWHTRKQHAVQVSTSRTRDAWRDAVYAHIVCCGLSHERRLELTEHGYKSG